MTRQELTNLLLQNNFTHLQRDDSFYMKALGNSEGTIIAFTLHDADFSYGLTDTETMSTQNFYVQITASYDSITYDAENTLLNLGSRVLYLDNKVIA